MIFTVHCPAFLAVANTVTKGLLTKDEKAQTLFEVKEVEGTPHLFIQCHSQTTFFRGEVPINSIEGVDNYDNLVWGVDGQQLKTIVSIIVKQDTTLSFTLSDTGRLFSINIGENNFKLSTYDAPMFQASQPTTEIATVLAVDFMSNVSNLSRLCSLLPVHQEHALSCLHLFLKENSLVYMATNSVTLSEVTQEAVCSVDKTMLLKPVQANLLLSNSYEGAETVQLISTETMFGYVDKYNTLCLVAVADIPPIEYRAIIGLTSEEQTLIVKSEELKYAVDSLAKLCAMNDELQLRMTGNKLTIENEYKDKMTVPTVGEFDDTDMKLLKTPLSTLFPLMTEDLRICWSNSQRRRIIKFQAMEEDTPIESLFMGMTANDQ